MEEFLEKLYSYEYFGTYLMISIAVLSLLFIIILFFGKKDKKNREIEATKKLQQINGNGEINTFGETGTPIPLGVPATPQENTELKNEEVVVPAMNMDSNVGSVQNEIPEPVLPSNEGLEMPKLSPEVPQEEVKVELPPIETPIENSIPEVEVPKVETPQVSEKPVLEKEEEKPFSFAQPEETPVDVPMPKEEPVEVKTEEPEIEVPEFNFDEIIESARKTEIDEEETPNNNEEEKIEKPKEVFSSVYVPQEKEEEEIELPKPNEKPEVKEEEDDIELPTLKKEPEIEKPELNAFDFNDLAGESYDINK